MMFNFNLHHITLILNGYLSNISCSHLPFGFYLRKSVVTELYFLMWNWPIAESPNQNFNAVSFSRRHWIGNWWNWMQRWRKWAGKPISCVEKLRRPYRFQGGKRSCWNWGNFLKWIAYMPLSHNFHSALFYHSGIIAIKMRLLRSNIKFNFVKLSFTFVFCQSTIIIQHSNSSIVTEIRLCR